MTLTLMLGAGQPLRVRRRAVGTSGRAVPGVPGHAAHFTNASAQSLTIPSNSTLQMGAGQTFALTCWVKPDSFANYRMVITKESGGAAAQLEYELRIDAGQKAEFVLSDGTNFNTLTSGINLSTSAWWWLYAEYHTSPTAQLVLIVNNNAADLLGANITPFSSTGTFGLGWDGRAGPTFSMDGAIDAVGIWKRALTSTERANVYNGGAGIRLSQHPELWANMVAGYELDESGTSWTDWFDSDHLTNQNGVTSVTGLT